MKNSKTSFLFSLRDSFEYKPSKLNSFIPLGDAALGMYHVVVFFRSVISSRLSIDLDNVIKPTNYCTVYNIINKRGTVYGVLFSALKSRITLKRNILYVDSDVIGKGDFTIYPYSNEKSPILLYRDSSHNLLVNIHNEASKFLVLDE